MNALSARMCARPQRTSQLGYSADWLLSHSRARTVQYFPSETLISGIKRDHMGLPGQADLDVRDIIKHARSVTAQPRRAVRL